jgi:hypothetical protein
MHTNRIPVIHSRVLLLANYLRWGPATEKDYGDQDFAWKEAKGSQ